MCPPPLLPAYVAKLIEKYNAHAGVLTTALCMSMGNSSNGSADGGLRSQARNISKKSIKGMPCFNANKSIHHRSRSTLGSPNSEISST